MNWKTLGLLIFMATAGTACGGSAWAVPGTIMTSNYDCGGQGVAYNDAETANQGGSYRTDGVDVAAFSDPGGNGFYVACTANGE